MTDASDDPALLFSPVQSASGAVAFEDSDHIPPTFTLKSKGRRDASGDAPRTRLYIEVPKLRETELSKYKPLDYADKNTDSDSEGTSKIEEMEGEYSLGSKRFLFARYGDGIVRRKEDWEFRTSHPELYVEYMKRKEEGTLPDFDPSSTRIHPKHRIALVISLQKRKNGRSTDRDYVSDSDSSDETEEELDDDGDYKDEYVRRSARASKRQASKHVRALPYSPRTTRVRRGSQSSHISVSDDSESEQSRPRRRSSRNAKRKSYTMEGESDYQSEVEESSEDEENQSLYKRKHARKQRGPKPAYGRIRKVEDMYESDPETAALRSHREECEKCHRASAHILLNRLNRRTKKKKKRSGESSEDEEEMFDKLGGWVRCLKCCVAAHWNCLARTQRAEILKAARAKGVNQETEGNGASTRMVDLDVDETTEFLCGSCSKGGLCMVCHEVAVEQEQKLPETSSRNTPDTGRRADDASGKKQLVESKPPLTGLEPAQELLFRCRTCKRLAHYAHLPVEDEDLTPAEVARFYQEENKWQCGDCASFIFPLDKILAWRPFPAGATDPYMSSPEDANYRENLPREYLVKWVGRSYRRVEWVPHMWLVATNWAKLKNFYAPGAKPNLLNSPASELHDLNKENPTGSLFATTEDERSRAASTELDHPILTADGPPTPLNDAESRIPPAWKTVDRVLDVLIWAPRKLNGRPQKKAKSSRKRTQDDDSEVEASAEAREEYDKAINLGEQPGNEVTETVEEFEKRTGQELGEEHIGRVIWAFIKWDDLLYEESTWDSPPRPGSFGYSEFERAFKYFLQSRKVVVKKKTAAYIAAFEARKSWSTEKLGVPEDGVYDIGQEKHLKLMPFQVQGVNWLCRNWFHHQQCILADEMGLGKTIQIITFLGLLYARMGAFPFLVVVPNSTITNWVREFARWAPELRVVPFYGEQKSRKIIKDYELQHSVIAPGTTGAKYHVLVTTYEGITMGKEFGPVFGKTPRWEVLVVDEGQRLKNDTSLIFKKLNELNTAHRVIMTGTPLNNNIRELFNLMNFLDPEKWKDLQALTREFEELDEERVKELHERLRPYFLRRVKAEVLDLPSKNEVIVPVSMAPLQKEIYKSILSKNLTILSSLRGIASSKLNKSVVKSSNLRNMLMQLRKCLQHPYLVADDIEPKFLSPIEAHLKLIDASGKLRLLKMLLPKLKARGHRVLLFSQFVIGLNIIEDFLQGEGYKFLRLDGDTKQAQRQKDMDEFNKENSDIFIFILSTRAGGVGINLWSADTVIIFDPDFNPHQDLQAISRAHRYGQKKTCLVFKLMMKDSAEEKIIQTGKKKLVLDHLIVQKMDDDDNSNGVQSILTFGAKALFDEGADANRDITYSEHDIDTLIEKIETEENKESAEVSNNAFSFAKVWSAQKDDLDEMPDEPEEDLQDDSWAQTLQKIAIEQARGEAREQTGRGARRKAALATKKYFEDVNADGSPDRSSEKSRKKRKSGAIDNSDDEYNLPRTREPTEASSSAASVSSLDVGQKRRKLDMDEPAHHVSKSRHGSVSLIMNRNRVEYCGLCLERHGPGQCPMTENSMNLVEYRKSLIESHQESYEDRARAVLAIDETLSQRGVLHLIGDQPSRPLRKSNTNPSIKFDQTKGSGGNFVSRHRPSLPGRSSSSTGEAWATDNRPVVQAPEPHREPRDGVKVLMTPIASLKRDVQPISAKLRPCDICLKAPNHLPVYCPVVKEGPASILKAVVRLTNEQGNSETLKALRNILRKQKKAFEMGGYHDVTQPAASRSNCS